LETAQSSGGDERKKVIGGAVAGAVLGQIFGRSTKSTIIGAAAGAAAGTAAAHASRSTYACLPEGSALRLTLSRDLVVRRGEI
jgi:outer membrane lipoprotein SlyB